MKINISALEKNVKSFDNVDSAHYEVDIGLSIETPTQVFTFPLTLWIKEKKTDAGSILSCSGGDQVDDLVRQTIHDHIDAYKVFLVVNGIDYREEDHVHQLDMGADRMAAEVEELMISLARRIAKENGTTVIGYRLENVA